MRIFEHPEIVDVPPDPLPALRPRPDPLVVLDRRLVVRNQVNVPPKKKPQRNDQRERDDRRKRLRGERKRNRTSQTLISSPQRQLESDHEARALKCGMEGVWGGPR